MQLLCNGVFLDLYENTNVQFTHDNPLYAFDKIKCERTTQFKLPCTPTNDSVFALARIPAYTGDGMRRKFDAQLQMSGIVQNGYLYVSAFDGKDYEAIFVTGELVGLQKIAQLGKIGEIMTYDEVVTLGVGSYSPQAKVNDIWANVEYKRPKADLLIPSIGLKQLYNTIADKYGLIVQAFPSELEGYRIIPKKAAGVDEMQHFVCTKNPNGGDQPYANEAEIPGVFNLLQYDDRLFEHEDVIYPVTIVSKRQYFKIRRYKFKTNLTLTFPDDWDDRYYMYKFEDLDNSMQPEYFYGDRSFFKEVNSNFITRTGESLKGRSVTFAAGDAFAFVCEDDFVNTSTGMSGQKYIDFGFINMRDTDNFFTDFAIKVSSAGELASGDICRLQDNLPDCTFVELCKTMAAIIGRVLNYNGSGYTNIIPKLPIIKIEYGVYDASTCTFTSTRTQNTDPAKNGFKIQTYYNNNYIQQIKTQDTIGTGYVTFTKTTDFNKLRVAFNGNRLAAAIYVDTSPLTNGTTYTFYYDVTLLDRTNTGNDAQVSNLCLVEGDEVVSWNDWKNNQLGLSFDELAFSEWPRKQDSELLKRGEVQRTFGDYQQNNIIRFKSNDVVTDNVTRVYVIQNDNLKAENVLQELPFSEGEVLDNALYIREESDNPTIGGMVANVALLTRVSLPVNSGLETLCAASTQYKIDVHMTALEYFGITAKTLLLIEGTLYTWTSRDWQNDKATFTLARL